MYINTCIYTKNATTFVGDSVLRKEGDSNPRYPYEYVSLANWWFQPLTHPSFRDDYCRFCQMRCKDTLLLLFVQIFEAFSLIYFYSHLQLSCFQCIVIEKRCSTRIEPNIYMSMIYTYSVGFNQRSSHPIKVRWKRRPF